MSKRTNLHWSMRKPGRVLLYLAGIALAFPIAACSNRDKAAKQDEAQEQELALLREKLEVRRLRVELEREKRIRAVIGAAPNNVETPGREQTEGKGVVHNRFGPMPLKVSFKKIYFNSKDGGALIDLLLTNTSGETLQNVGCILFLDNKDGTVKAVTDEKEILPLRPRETDLIRLEGKSYGDADEHRLVFKCPGFQDMELKHLGEEVTPSYREKLAKKEGKSDGSPEKAQTPSLPLKVEYKIGSSDKGAAEVALSLTNTSDRALTGVTYTVSWPPDNFWLVYNAPVIPSGHTISQKIDQKIVDGCWVVFKCVGYQDSPGKELNVSLENRKGREKGVPTPRSQKDLPRPEKGGEKPSDKDDAGGKDKAIRESEFPLKLEEKSDSRTLGKNGDSTFTFYLTNTSKEDVRNVSAADWNDGKRVQRFDLIKAGETVRGRLEGFRDGGLLAVLINTDTGTGVGKIFGTGLGNSKK